MSVIGRELIAYEAPVASPRNPRGPQLVNVSAGTSLAALGSAVLSIATALVPLVTHYADVARILGPTWAAAIVVLALIAIVAACVCAAGHSVLHLLPPNAAEHVDAAATTISGVLAAGAHPMNLIQDLGILEAAASELSSFAAGTPITTMKTIGGVNITATGTHFGATPDPSYQVITGSFWQILGVALSDAAALSAGTPVKIAEKIGNSWYGTAFTVAKAA